MFRYVVFIYLYFFFQSKTVGLLHCRLQRSNHPDGRCKRILAIGYSPNGSRRRVGITFISQKKNKKTHEYKFLNDFYVQLTLKRIEFLCAGKGENNVKCFLQF